MGHNLVFFSQLFNSEMSYLTLCPKKSPYTVIIKIQTKTDSLYVYVISFVSSLWSLPETFVSYVAGSALHFLVFVLSCPPPVSRTRYCEGVGAQHPAGMGVGYGGLCFQPLDGAKKSRCVCVCVCSVSK